MDQEKYQQKIEENCNFSHLSLNQYILVSDDLFIFIYIQFLLGSFKKKVHTS